MKASEIESLTSGIYRVQIRKSTMDRKGKVTHTAGRRVLRQFLGTDLRMGSIPCAVFTSALSKRHFHAQEVSVPHYDLLEAVKVTPPAPKPTREIQTDLFNNPKGN